MSIATLFVDLDGTLIKTDSLLLSVRQLIQSKPWSTFALPLWLLKGRPYLKEQIACRVTLDVTQLPYNKNVLDFIRQERNKNRSIVLATGANYRIGQAVADYLDCFDLAIGSSISTNLIGTEKLKAIQRHMGDQPFDYIGDSLTDVPIFAAATQPIAVTPSPKLLAALKRMDKAFLTF